MSGRSIIDLTIPAVSPALTIPACQIVNRRQQAAGAGVRQDTEEVTTTTR